ncbi:MAG TPA: thioesterase domain-containing protein, partial [Nannocystis sp.]
REALLHGPHEQLRARVHAYLREQVAAIVGGPPDFDPDTALADLGVDSLMAVDLHEALRSDLGVDLSLAATLQGDTLEKLGDHLTAALRTATPANLDRTPPAPLTTNTASPWLRAIGPVPATPRLRLICFPHSGAGPTAFLPWRGKLPADVAALAVQLPGRWERLTEHPLTRMDRLLEQLLPALTPLLKSPFAFFGVSMGALVAHALTCALRRAGHPLPAHLFVAAYPAPHLPNPLLRHRDVLREALRDDSGAHPALRRLGLIPEALQGPDTLRLLLPALRADFELVLHHEPREEPPLSVALTALGGREDPEVSREQLAAWLSHTAGDFALRMLPGGHLCFRTHPDATLAAIAPTLHALSH